MRRLLLILVLAAGGTVQAAPPPGLLEKPIGFEGYVLSDSLEYNAESIEYYFNDRRIELDRNARVNYLGRVLTSNTITFFQDYNYLEALGGADSTGALQNLPRFSDQNGETLEGSEIMYNISTQKGVVLGGHSRYEEGFMAASTIKRASDDTLFIADGTYTTCDLEHPHYYFRGSQMKFILNDKIIIRPITAYLFDIPVLWFPFYVFPISQGRESGFLTPRYGASRLDGRYFSNIGYYFAPSEYFDYRFATTLRERNGWLINNWINYNKRYTMNGSIYASFENEPRLGTRQWRITGSHRSTISPTLTVSGRVNLQSSEFSQFNSSNYLDRLNRNINSQFNLTKRWRESGNSITIDIQQTQNLDSKSRTTTAPRVSFTMPKKLIFGETQSTGTVRKYTMKASESMAAEPAWYRNIYYSLSADFDMTESDTFTNSAGHTDYDLHRFRSVKTGSLNTGFTASNKLFGWITANPSVNLRERFTSTTDSLGFSRQDNITAGLSFSTKVYGTFAPHIGSLTGLRHVLSPSVSYQFGRQRLHSGTTSEVLYRFDRADDTDSGKISQMSLNLRNHFQAKFSGADGEERKLDLFTLDFSGSVNFENDKRPISPLTTTLDMQPSRSVSVRFNATHDFYHTDDTFHLFSPYLTTLGVTTTVGVSGRNTGTMGISSRPEAERTLGRDQFDADTHDASADVPEPGGLPFTLRFTHYYSINRVAGGTPGTFDYRETHTIKPTLTFHPTENTSLTYDLYFDIKGKSLNQHRMTVHRDLHCWEANISWVPSGPYEGFFAMINIKELPDVKIERRRGGSRLSGF